MKVIDAGTLIAAFIERDGMGDRAREHLNVDRLAAPELIDIETCSALRQLDLAGRLPTGTATTAMSRLARLSIERHTHSPLLDRCWQLRHNVTPYEAAYVALAEALDVPLVTTDAHLARATGPRCAFEVLT